MSHVGVYKCLSLIVGTAITVAIWLREVVSCRDFILRAVATFWAMSLVGIYNLPWQGLIISITFNNMRTQPCAPRARPLSWSIHSMR